MCQASTAPPATIAPMTAASAAWVVGSTLTIVRIGRPPPARLDAERADCSPRVHRRRPAGRFGYLRLRTMREAFHDQLDAIFTDLAEICGQVEVAVHRATEALLTGDAAIAEQVISADEAIDDNRERVEDNAFALLSLQQPVAGDLRMIVSALRMVSELERMGDLSVHVAKIARLRVPNVAVPDEIRPTMERMAEVAEDMVRRVTRSSPTATSRPRSSSAATTRSWTSSAAAASPSCSRRLGARRRGGRRHRPARALLRADRRPRGLGRQPRRLRRHRRAAEPRLTARQRPWFATAAAAAAAASGSRYCPPATVGRKSSSSS